MTWENAVAVMYVSAVALYVVYGFTIKDSQLKDVMTKSGILKLEVTEGMLSALKMLYLLSMPALVLLGLHLASEMASAGGAPATITNSLTTAFQVFQSIYIMTLLFFVIIILKNSINMFAGTVVDTISAFRSKRFKR